MKVYEFAKELKMETLALMDHIRKWKLPIKSHMAALDDETIAKIRAFLAEKDKPKAVAKKKTKKKAAAKKKTVTKKKAVTKKAPAKKKAAVKKKTVIAKAISTKTITKKAMAAAAPKVKKAAQEVVEESSASVKKAKEAPAKKAIIRRRAGQEEVPDIRKDDTAESQEGAEAPKRSKMKVIARMDPSQVQPKITPPVGSVRTGFMSPPPSMVPPSHAQEKIKQEERASRKAPKKKAPTAPGTFSTSDFRKKEVIFMGKARSNFVGKPLQKTQITTPAAHKRVVDVNNEIAVSELAAQMGLKTKALIRELVKNGVDAKMNTVLDFDTVALIVPELGFEAKNTFITLEAALDKQAFGSLEAEKVPRSPVVTVMGHVDHGKTTLLDAIRKTNVVTGEAGGITQHIGAYSVQLDTGVPVTFIDTPGHAAFTSMRARGAHVTDVVIIVVAADDGVMPQTEEAINHAKAAGVPIIVAVNKMDAPGANPEKIKQKLTEYELVSEEWGGDTAFCEMSALKGEGVKELVERVQLVAEILELKANPKRSGTGVVIESRMEKGRGVVATFLVKDGTVKIGDYVLAGKATGRVRNLMNDRGDKLKAAGPGEPVEVLGLSVTPNAGDRFDVCKSEGAMKDLLRVAETSDNKVGDTPETDVLEILAKMKGTGQVEELSLVIKSDVAGSLEAIKGMLGKIESDEASVKVIHSAVGAINESDILLAATTKSAVIGFNVRPDASAKKMAQQKGIHISVYTIIYELMDDVKKMLEGLLQPDTIEKSVGSAQVREVFHVSKIGTIAGCMVSEGTIARNHLLRLVRDGRQIYEGQVSSLKRFKDDAKEVSSGYECGIGIENFNDIKPGDVIEAYVKEEVPRTL